MNIAEALPESLTQKLASAVRSRFAIFDAAATERGRTAEAGSRPYSFLSDCECPDDCLRDHENE